jgi:DNA-binding beta-propeller fold protein YncE
MTNRGPNDQSPHPPEHRTETALSDAWEALVRGELTATPETVAFVRGVVEDLATIDHVPPLSPVRRERIWEDMMAAVAVPRSPVTIPMSHGSSPNGRVFMAPPRVARLPVRSPRLVAILATAALVLLGFAVFLLANPGVRQRSDERGGDPVMLPAVPNEPVAFVWESRGTPDPLQPRGSTDAQTPLIDPYHLAIDPHGNLWVPDTRTNRFQILAPDGTLRQAWGSKGRDEGEFNFLNVAMTNEHGAGAAAFDAAGNLYVADPGNFRIQKFGPDLRFLTAWGSKGEGEGQFLGLTDLAIDDQGNVFALDALRSTVQVFDANGEFLRSWGSRGVNDGEFLTPYGLAVATDGTVVVADTGNHRLQQFSSEGTVLAVWGLMGTQAAMFREPDDVAIDVEGRIFVTDTSNNRVQILDANGQFLAEWGERGSKPGQFITPTGIALDEVGDVYVSEAGDANERVQKFRLLPPLGP